MIFCNWKVIFVFNFEIPDFDGIEIKTRHSYSKAYITLFNAVPTGSNFHETKRLRDEYWYPCKNDKYLKEFKNFLFAIEKGFIKLSLKIGSYNTGFKYGMVKEHGVVSLFVRKTCWWSLIHIASLIIYDGELGTQDVKLFFILGYHLIWDQGVRHKKNYSMRVVFSI